MSFKNILVVPKHPDLEAYLKNWEGSAEDLKQKLREMHQDAEGMFNDYNNHNATMNEVIRILDKHSKENIDYTVAYPEGLQEINFSEYDLIMPVGGDGTLLHPAHYCFNQLFFGVNSNPQKGNRKGSIGHWLSTDMQNFERDFTKILNYEYYLKEIPRLEAIINNGEPYHSIALNEIALKKFGFKNAKYTIVANGKEEFQQSSGMVAALKEGATGWLENIHRYQPYDGHEDEIQWVNEEPKNKGKDYSMNQGFSDHIRIISEDENNVVTLDSNEEKFCYPLKRGQILDIKISNYPLNIIYADRS